MPDPDCDNECVASVDSIMDYGPCAISQRNKGNFMYSTATTQSKMDFSAKSVEDNVVNSSPNGWPRPLTVSSFSPLGKRQDRVSGLRGVSYEQKLKG